MQIRNIYTALLLSFMFFSGYCQEKKKTEDHFSKIGTRKTSTRIHLLEEKLPPVLANLYLPKMSGKKSAFQPMDKMDTPEELKRELSLMDAKFTPFMANFAPKLKATRKQLQFNELQWRIETVQDQQNFTETLQGKGDWTNVKIPHYGPPEGRATTYYFKTFELDSEMLNFESQFICFKGVDYRTKVFINGALVGVHEGFFAPFEFNISKHIKSGVNTVLIKVENDFSTLGSPDAVGAKQIGNKIYAATGLGWDDPDSGWHHCPPGMGIYQECYIESRNPIHINDVFVRPLPKEEAAEVWIEVNNFHKEYKKVKFNLSLYGQNFKDTIFQNLEYIPSTTYIPGVGDLAKPSDWQTSQLEMGYGVNFLKVKVPVKSPKIWNNEHPWLYQLQINLFDKADKLTDNKATQFGMRTFAIDTISVPKGQFYLNGEKIKLRGANTMGYMQQDVFKKDWKQLKEDILLAKICNLNFIRLTQRPVQPEIYEYADKLGIMLQTDLPLFGSLRPNLFAEGIKQAGEMERLVRNHPSNIMVTYMNERFPNGEGHPQRNMSEVEEYLRFYKACDQIVLQLNPDRVIKPADGDYDPPSPGLPDSHMYNIWYNGHALGLGELHKGYWQKVKPDWFYACGEFGSEALDSYQVIKKYWPKTWLPKNENEQWFPDKVVKAQTNRFHYMWYPTPVTLKDWINVSQNHQVWGTRLVTEAFRRDPNMMSFAIHLFIDAWPAGWMKALMDVDRIPKKAWFTYRDALAPIMVNLRTDRYKFYEGEEINIEAWLMNDLNIIPENHKIKWQLEQKGKVVASSESIPDFPLNSSKFQGFIKFKAPEVTKRSSYNLRMALFNENSEAISESLIELEIFPEIKTDENLKVFTANPKGKVGNLLKELREENNLDIASSKVILIDEISFYEENKQEIDNLVKQGKTVVFLELPVGEFTIGRDQVVVEKTVMGQYYFVSPQTDHSIVKDVQPFDFKFWYNDSKGLVSPILSTLLKVDGSWEPILKTGKTTWVDISGEYAAAMEMKSGLGKYRICQLKLNNRIKSNPTASIFVRRLLTK
ncbi:glycoside hydrolase family 2 [Maribacter sp. ANRC-HE7]|uniref:Glycoside hydrolase family 2 n=1 Tax=Maribacter aquimaris TaxID=2737171 RepID=A0ABR7UYY7_9FLAO|nr:sugar-binding domain-containing protein [Maribacter aquimaris]MBD0777819.1 glycoside hydrolase family 2 [Maribacter aquimaris]